MRSENLGARAYFKGNGVNVLKNVPESALKLAVNDRGQRMVLARERERGAGAGAGGEARAAAGAHLQGQQQPRRRLTVAERLSIGGAAGGVAQILVYPLEVIQTRLAAPAHLVSHPSHHPSSSRSSAAASKAGAGGGYRGIVDCALKIYRHEGPRAFGRGLLPTVLGILPYAGVDIATFELLKERLTDGDTEKMGAAARRRPRRSRSRSRRQENGSEVEIDSKSRPPSRPPSGREEWGGAWWWDDAAPPPPSVYDDDDDGDELDLDAAANNDDSGAAAASSSATSTSTSATTTSPAVALLGAGVVSSAVAQAFAYPLGLVRTRLQVDGAGGRPRMYKSMAHCFSEVVAQEGLRGLYKGFAANLMKVAPAASISWWCYEESKRALDCPDVGAAVG